MGAGTDANQFACAALENTPEDFTGKAAWIGESEVDRTAQPQDRTPMSNPLLCSTARLRVRNRPVPNPVRDGTRRRRSTEIDLWKRQ